SPRGSSSCAPTACTGPTTCASPRGSPRVRWPRGAPAAQTCPPRRCSTRRVGKAIAFLGLHAGVVAIAAVAWDRAALDALARAEGWTRDDALLAGGPT